MVGSGYDSEGLRAIHKLVTERPAEGVSYTQADIYLVVDDYAFIEDWYNYRGQRRLVPTSLAGMRASFSRGMFHEGSQVSMAMASGDRPVLVDGQHRIDAARQAGWAGYWSFRMIWDEAAEVIYPRLDSNQVKRTTVDAGRSLEDRIDPRVVALIDKHKP